MKYLKDEKEISEGEIFFIPLFLPDWTVREQDDLINYGSYNFPDDGTYAFGRLIEFDESGYDLIEVFRFIGSIPSDPFIITSSGRLFNPVHVALSWAFKKKRYRSVFADEHYDKFRDSDYDKITFLFPTSIWIGGESTPISIVESKKLFHDYDGFILYLPSHIENKIRAAIRPFFDFDYEASVSSVLASLPKPRAKDAAFKKKIAPFLFFEVGGVYSVSLDAGSYKTEMFEKKGLLGNGYDWTKIAETFIAGQMPEMAKLFTFDPEAGTFSVMSKNKKAIKHFAESFKAACDGDKL